MKPPADTHVAPTEDRKSERILEKTSQRCFMIVAVDADHAHQINDDTHRRLGAVDFGLDGKFISGGRLRVYGVACAPAQIPRRFDRDFCIGKRIAYSLMLDNRMNAST